ncbi:MAG: hypothetical protein ACRD5M_15170 [Candidatus Acidiferrales bacterium]
MSSAPTPQQKNNQALWWILGILGGALALMVILGLVVAGVVMRHVNVRENGQKVEIETPVGAIRVNSDEGHPTGLPIYPGATKVKSEGAAVEFASKDGAPLGIAAEKYETSDDLEKVAAWYAQKLGPSYKREKPHSGTHYVRGVSTKDADAVFVNDTSDGARVVALTEKSGGVDIELIRAGKKEIQ